MCAAIGDSGHWNRVISSPLSSGAEFAELYLRLHSLTLTLEELYGFLTTQPSLILVQRATGTSRRNEISDRLTALLGERL